MQTVKVENQMLEAIVEKSIDGLVVLDQDRIVQFLNPAAASILNQNATALLGQRFAHPIGNGQSSEIEIVREGGKAGTGEIRTVDISRNGKPAYLISIRDITERIVFDRLKDDFISTVSHELRTPLTSMREAISVLHDGILGDVNEEQKDFLSLCLRNTDLLRRIVSDLLDISKIEAGRVKLKKARIPLSEVLQSAVDSFLPLAKSKHIDLKLEMTNDDVDVYVDQDRIVQVINNLIGNALKFTEKGWVDVHMQRQGDQVECIVKDTGRGIDEEDINHVFEKFQQFGSVVDPENKGTGLGLAISREIIELHGGTIRVESKLDQGSTFSFALPRYNYDLEVLEVIRSHLTGKKDISTLFTIQLQDMPNLTDAIRNDLFELITKKVRSAYEKPGKMVSASAPVQNMFHLVIDSGYESRLFSRKRFLRIIKEAAFESKLNEELDFSYGLSVYPEESKSPETLLAISRDHVIHEKTERLRRRIFIVDDEKEMTESLKTLLGFFGYANVHTMNRGNEVFDRLDEGIPDLVILDMKMPGMSGYEVVGRLKERFETKDIPILIMSGYEVETGQFLEYVNTKAILTVSKPVDAEMLKKMVYFLI
ncbi:hybrid sensor histidine kinase/response regulator [candidate division KSB1 bacterium]|nr:hybrid sensor histidine kinase/response regulator [candidate division KSB1 bacterium]